jgi:hypothetical protein
MTTRWLVALFAVCWLGDARGDDKKDDEPDFTGSYSYTGSYTISLTSPQAATVTNTEEGHLTVTASKKSGLILTFTAKGETCQLTATRAGKDSIKLATGQTCSMSDANQRMDFTLTLTSGSGSLHGDALAMNLGWKLSGSASGVSIAGRATETVQAEAK